MRAVLTGGPGVGKTTVLQELQKRGFETVPEVARTIIKEGKVLPWMDLKGFQAEVAARQLLLESRLNGHPVFLDRGLVDGLAYGAQLPEDLCRGRYNKVFLLARLPNYQTDAERKETPEEAKMLHEKIRTVYQHQGYRVIDVPVLEPTARVDWILRNVGLQ